MEVRFSSSKDGRQAFFRAWEVHGWAEEFTRNRSEQVCLMERREFSLLSLKDFLREGSTGGWKHKQPISRVLPGNKASR
jgi:hypothetical protein